MPVKCPPLPCLGGEDQFPAYQAEFGRLYHSRKVEDVRGRRVVFEADACEHVCFKDQREDRYRKLARVWTQERAERIGWIELALKTPEEIRPSHQTEGHEAYLLLLQKDPGSGPAWERFGVYVEPLSKKAVRFVTAFPMEKWYWDQARLKGPRIYPPSEPKKRKR